MLKRLLLLLLSGLLLLTGCGGGKNSSNSTKTGTLSVKISDAAFKARIIQPSLDMKIASYRISGNGPNEATFPAMNITEDTATISSLVPGDWTITVDAKNAAGDIIASGYAETTIISGTTSPVSIEVRPLEGNGVLRLALSWPAGIISDPLVTGKLTSQSTDAVTPLNFNLAGNKLSASYENTQLAAGYYLLSVQLNNADYQSWGAVEAVRIIAGQTSEGSYPLTTSQIDPNEGGLVVDIKPDLQNPIVITFSGQVDEIREGTSMTITATASEQVDSYQWYLDGKSLNNETSTTITIGSSLKLGGHRLDLVVTKGHTVSSEAVHFKVISASATPSPSPTPTPTPVIPQPGSFTVAAGDDHCLALKNGTVYAWGRNTYGQLGTGSFDATNARVAVPGLNGITQVVSGQSHSLAVASNGDLYGWGYNNYGQLGNNSTQNLNVPSRILTNVTAVAAGNSHTLALKGDGTVWSWGDNSYGQLGNGTKTTSYNPVPVSNLSGIVAITAGSYHSLALKNDGTIWAWGSNMNGKLGINSTEESPIPKQVHILTDAIAIAGGGSHSLAVKSDGTVWGWGYNNYQQITTNTSKSSYPEPVLISGLSGIIKVAAGEYHSLALRNDGTVWSWGSNGSDQLGRGNGSTNGVPTQISSVSGVVAISSQFSSNLAQTASGILWSWGKNNYGQLGNDSTENSNIPVTVLGL